MAYDFNAAGSWAQQIADVSSLPEYQNCTIQLIDPTLQTTVYDVDTGVYAITGDPVLVETQARVIGIRATNDQSGASTGNPTGIKGIRVQFPYAAYPSRVKRGWQVRVIDGGRNPALLGYIFAVESDTFSGNRASHTIDCSVDVESSATWV